MTGFEIGDFNVEVDSRELARLLTGPSGDVFRWMVRIGDDIKSEAKKQVGVDTGRLRDKIVKRVTSTRGGITLIVAAEESYAEWHHEGTRPHTIRPRNASVLSFIGAGGQRVFASKVEHPGTRPNRFLTDPTLRVLRRYTT